MSKKVNVSSNGIGFTTLLTLAFIILKLCHQINWSWVWILSPLWLSASIILLCLFVIVIIVIIKEK